MISFNYSDLEFIDGYFSGTIEMKDDNRKKEFVFDFGYDVGLDLLDIFKIHETTQGFEGDPYDIYSQDDFRYHYEPYARQDIRYRFEQKYGSARRSSDYEYDFY